MAARMSNIRAWSAADETELRDLAERGYSVRQIAALTDRTEGSVKNKIQRLTALGTPDLHGGSTDVTESDIYEEGRRARRDTPPRLGF